LKIPDIEKSAFSVYEKVKDETWQSVMTKYPDFLPQKLLEFLGFK
jgi:hypothetical protein